MKSGRENPDISRQLADLNSELMGAEGLLAAMDKTEPAQASDKKQEEKESRVRKLEFVNKALDHLREIRKNLDELKKLGALPPDTASMNLVNELLRLKKELEL